MINRIVAISCLIGLQEAISKSDFKSYSEYKMFREEYVNFYNQLILFKLKNSKYNTE